MQIVNYTSVPSLSPLFLSSFLFIPLYFFDHSCKPAGFIDFIVEPTFSGLIDTAEKVIGPLIEEERQAKESGNRRTRYYDGNLFSKTSAGFGLGSQSFLLCYRLIFQLISMCEASHCHVYTVITADEM